MGGGNAHRPLSHFFLRLNSPKAWVEGTGSSASRFRGGDMPHPVCEINCFMIAQLQRRRGMRGRGLDSGAPFPLPAFLTPLEERG